MGSTTIHELFTNLHEPARNLIKSKEMTNVTNLSLILFCQSLPFHTTYSRSTQRVTINTNKHDEI